MSRVWKPGDVAIAHDQDWEFVVVRHDGSPDYWSAADGEWPIGVSADLLNYRPLVVIDPEDREQVARLADAFCTARWSHTVGSDECDPLTRSSMKEALDAYLAPPKPDEPQGLGAVVRVPSARGPEFGLKLLVRGHATKDPWMGDGIKQDWRDIEGPIEILSDGVQP